MNEIKNPRVAIIIAALNEEEGIVPTIDELKHVLEKTVYPFDILVVDGNSVDRTAERACQMNIPVIQQEGEGKGNAIAQALKHLESKYSNPAPIDFIAMIDADFTYPGTDFPKMIEILRNNPDIGMVIGNRFNGQFEFRKNISNMFYIGNRLLELAHHLLNGIFLKDPLSGMRVIRKDLLNDWKPVSKGFDIEVELNHRVKEKGYDISEIHIAYRRRLGEKKLKLRHGLTIFKRILVQV